MSIPAKLGFNSLANIWFQLRSGVFCIYKCPDLSMLYGRQVLITNIVEDLNKLPRAEMRKMVSIEDSAEDGYDVCVKDRLSSHPLVIGKSYELHDVKISHTPFHGRYTSGICLIGLNRGGFKVHNVMKSNLLRTYHLSGQLGKATAGFYYTGKALEKTGYKHVTRAKIEKVCMVIQAGHQRKSLEMMGLDMCSQEAYEALSEEGLPRPLGKTAPLIYALKCINFEPPFFTLEMVCIHENEGFLLNLVHDIGLMLKTTATSKKLRCIRVGPFDLSMALTKRNWRLEPILENIKQIRPLFHNITPKSHNLEQISSEGKGHELLSEKQDDELPRLLTEK